MRVLLVLSSRKVLRAENLSTYKAVARLVPGITWVNGTAFDLYRMGDKVYLYMDQIDPAAIVGFCNG